MTAPNNLVSILIRQHRDLQKDLGNVDLLVQGEKLNAIEIASDLRKFRVDLLAHLELENGVFYVELLQKMKEKGQDTTKTELFIEEMHEIGTAVMVFLDMYKEAGSIEADILKFSNELHKIISVLNLRIESEESGVYAYWGLF